MPSTKGIYAVLCLLIVTASASAVPSEHPLIRQLLTNGAPPAEARPVTTESPSQHSPAGAFSCPPGANFTNDQQGNGQVDVTADKATVDLRIQSTNSSAAIARNEAAIATTAVESALAKLIPTSGNQIKTTSISIQPQINSTNGNNTVTGYQYTLGLSVTVINATGDLLAKVLDAAVQAGGNILQIQDVNFGLSDAAQAAAIRQARSRAIADAQSSVAFFAKQLEIQLGPIVGFSESSPPSSAPQSAKVLIAASESASTPLPATTGGVTVTSQITLTHTYCNA